MWNVDEKITRHTARLRMAAVLGAALLVSGCAGGLPQFSGPKAPSSTDQVVIPEPAPVVTKQTLTATTTRTSPAVTPRAPATPTFDDVSLSVLYYVRLAVPAGSDLTLRADSASGAAPTIKTIKTAGGLPYNVDIPVNAADDAYPMTIDATLESTIGHVLTGSITLDAKPRQPVEIVLAPKAE